LGNGSQTVWATLYRRNFNLYFNAAGLFLSLSGNTVFPGRFSGTTWTYLAASLTLTALFQ
jgi:hypothetical protein